MRKINLRHRNWVVAITYTEDPKDWTRRRETVFRAVEQQDHATLAKEQTEIIATYEEEATALGGTLRRNIIGQWKWSDGTAETRVRDLYARDCWPNYRCRAAGDGTNLVEVMERDLRPGSPLAEELAWCRDAAIRTDHSGDHSGQSVLHQDGRMTRGYADPATGETTGARVIPRVLLVPDTEWDRRGFAVVGAQWDKNNEPELLQRASELGWKP